jgi:hypothetical protein
MLKHARYGRLCSARKYVSYVRHFLTSVAVIGAHMLSHGLCAQRPASAISHRLCTSNKHHHVKHEARGHLASTKGKGSKCYVALDLLLHFMMSMMMQPPGLDRQTGGYRSM